MPGLLLSIFLAASFLDATPVPVERDGIWGYETISGAPVIPARYLLAAEFNRFGLAAVLDSSGWVFIDTTGRTVIRPLIVDNGPDYFSNGLARFSRDGKIGFFDQSGKVTIPATIDYARSFSGTRAAFCTGCTKVRKGEYTKIAGGRWGFIDLAGQPVIPPVYRDVHDFENGQAEVKKNVWWQCIDTMGVKVDCRPEPEDTVTRTVPDPSLTAVRDAEYPVQRISGDSTFEAAYVRESKLVFKDCLQPVLREAAALQPGAEPDTVLVEKCRECYLKYYQSMKGNTNITFKDLDEALRWIAGNKAEDVFRRTGVDHPVLFQELREENNIK